MRSLLRRLFITVPVLWVAVAHVGPLLAMVRISLLDVFPLPPGTAASFSLAAYAAFFAGAGYIAALLHSLMLAAAATLVAFVLAWPLAWHVAVHVPRQRRFQRLALLAAPFWTSEVLRMFALVLLLGNRGAVNATLRWLGLTGAPLPLLYNGGSVLAGIVYTVLLTMLLPLYAALARLPRDLLDAAADLGAGRWRRQLYVALPLARSGIAAGAALTFLMSLGILAAPALLGGAGTPVFASVIAGLFAGSSGRWPMGAAFGLLLLGTAIACAAGMAWTIRRGLAPAAGRRQLVP